MAGRHRREKGNDMEIPVGKGNDRQTPAQKDGHPGLWVLPDRHRERSSGIEWND